MYYCQYIALSTIINIFAILFEMNQVNLVWFRRDSRLEDNEIVKESGINGFPTLYFFVLDEWFLTQDEVGVKRVKFLFESLISLDMELRTRGCKLHIFLGKSSEVISQLGDIFLAKGVVPQLFFNKDIQVEYGVQRDLDVLQSFSDRRLRVYQGLNYFLQTKRIDGQDWRKEYYGFQNQQIISVPALTPLDVTIDLPQIQPSELFKRYPRFDVQHESLFTGGSSHAHHTLETFLTTRSSGYHWKLSRPYLAQIGSTSHLSAHLTFHTISPRFVYQQAKQKAQEFKDEGNSKRYFSLRAFRDRLRWKDSFTQRLWDDPSLKWRNRFNEFDSYYIPGELSEEQHYYFEVWKQGRTGFLMVDAAMRQLNEQGWMNFRMRAMCANFLTVILGVSWHHGAQYFMQQLVDGDIAINHWQWQMQAGITNPLSPTFRIYNPDKNLQEKDPDFEYVRYWIDELKGLSRDEILLKYSMGMIKGYPDKIIDFNSARRLNGAAVSAIRTKVRERIVSNSGEMQEAQSVKKAVSKYMQFKNKEYRENVGPQALF